VLTCVYLTVNDMVSMSYWVVGDKLIEGVGGEVSVSLAKCGLMYGSACNYVTNVRLAFVNHSVDGIKINWLSWYWWL